MSPAVSLAGTRPDAAALGEPVCAAADAPEYGVGSAGVAKPLSHQAWDVDSGSDRKPAH